MFMLYVEKLYAMFGFGNKLHVMIGGSFLLWWGIDLVVYIVVVFYSVITIEGGSFKACIRGSVFWCFLFMHCVVHGDDKMQNL